MAIYADRVKETTTTTGLGTYSLAGATPAFRTFVAGVGSGNVVTYVVEDGVNYEIAEGTVTSGAPDTLSRTSILFSSNANSAVNWTTGTRNIFLTGTATRAVFSDKSTTFTQGMAFSTATATNFSSGNAVITGGSIAGSITGTAALSTGVITNFSTANAQITGGSVAAATIAGTLPTSNVSLYDSVTLTSTNQTYYPQFTDRATSGNSGTYFGTGLTFNPSTNTLTTTTFTGTFSGTASITSGSISGVTAAFSTLVATNFSSGNAVITGGNIATNYLIATNFSSGNAAITGGSIAGSHTGTAAFSTATATNFSTGNAQITGGSIAGSITGTAAFSTAVSTNFSTGNAQITGGAISGVTAAASTLVATNFSSGNAVISGGSISGITTLSQTGDHSVTSNTQATSTTTGALKLTGGMSIATGNLYIGGSGTNAIVHTGHIIPSANATMNLGSASAWYGTFYGSATQAKYADLAENYLADAHYEPGVVLEFGGTREVTLATADTKRVAGVVSTNPAYLMNGMLSGDYVASLALQGRVPCNVCGVVEKGDLMVSAGLGFAKANNSATVGQVIGKALESFAGGHGQIEVVVGRV